MRALCTATLALALAIPITGCGGERGAPSGGGHDDPTPSTAAVETTVDAPSAANTAAETPTSSACPSDMALVAGAFCLTPEERCIEHQDIQTGHGITPNQCTRYAEPTVCFDNRRKPLRFCMDRFEWPNRKGELPRTLVSWQSARDLCSGAGKRLCTEEEFDLACEGEEMRPYVYGFARDATKCNFDKPYRPRTFAFTPFDECQSNPACKAAYDAIDQRLPAGSLETCRSPEGIYDLNGNANEWVIIPGAKSPHRSGIKGGWWGPVRNRCRPTVTFHDEADFGYEVGFRCCADGADPATGHEPPRASER